MASEARLREVSQLLDRHRETLHQLPGVVSTGVGAKGDDPRSVEIVIQLFVRSAEHVADVGGRAKAIIGSAAEVEVINTGEIVAGDQ